MSCGADGELPRPSAVILPDSVPGGTNGSPTSKFSPEPDVGGCGGGAGTTVSFGPGGAEFITFGVPLPGPALTAGTASVEGLPLAPAAAAEALAALGLSDVVALSILLTSA